MKKNFHSKRSGKFLLVGYIECFSFTCFRNPKIAQTSVITLIKIFYYNERFLVTLNYWIVPESSLIEPHCDFK